MAKRRPSGESILAPNAAHETREALEETLAFIGMFMNRGYSNTRIKEKLLEERNVSVSLVQVGRYVNQIRERWREPLKFERDREVRESVMAWDDLRAAAWEAYLASAGSEVTTTKEYGVPLEIKVTGRMRDASKKIDQNWDGDKGHKKGSVRAELALIKEVVKEVQRLPAVQFMNIIALCRRAKDELLGLYPSEDQQAGEGTRPALDWRTRLQALPPPDQVERMIEQVRQGAKEPAVEGEIVPKDTKGDK